MNEARYLFYIDRPTEKTIFDDQVSIDGWLIPAKGDSVRSVRVYNGRDYYNAVYGNERRDVAMHFSDIEESRSLKSGFSVTIAYIGLDVVIEVDFGKGYEEVHLFKFEDRSGRVFEKNYNAYLADRVAEHEDNIHVSHGYYYESKRDQPVNNNNTAHKLVAFYLPQFHPLPENDTAWGHGFTEWTNVTSAKPRFVGHNQPVLPSDLGYYDLRLDQSIKDQIDLAKHYGIYGFCIYYYWFSGKKILNGPVEAILKHKEWDFNFSICWANENWTKRWDGQDNEIILQQEYNDDDPLRFIKDVEDILLDSRYIRHDNKPVLLVYRPEHLGDPEKYVDVWRKYFKQNHKTDLHIVSVLSFSNTDPRKFGMDAAVRFTPSGLGYAYRSVYDTDTPSVDVSDRLIDKNFDGHIQDYRKAILDDNIIGFEYDFPSYPCVMPGWDNDARKKGRGTCFVHSTPELYEKWLEVAVGQASKEYPYVFINAWNEWAEGAVLEPTRQYGHAFLQRTADVLEGVGGMQRTSEKKKLAVVVHLYYIDQWDYLKEKINLINVELRDVFVVLQQTSSYFKKVIESEIDDAHILVLPNRGRDILPFMVLMRQLRRCGYESVLKLHTKKSTHREDGLEWFHDVVDKLIPDTDRASEYIDLVSNEQAIIGPEGHIVSLDRYMGGNKDHIKVVIEKMYGFDVAEKVIGEADKYCFVAGSMFYVNIESLNKLTDLYLEPADFEPEKGQIDGTMAHAIERVLSLTVLLGDGNIYHTSKKGAKRVKRQDINDGYSYAPKS